MPVEAASALYEPINTYEPFPANIGIAEGPFECVTLLGMKIPWPFTTRMTVVQLATGELLLIRRSPLMLRWQSIFSRWARSTTLFLPTGATTRILGVGAGISGSHRPGLAPETIALAEGSRPT